MKENRLIIIAAALAVALALFITVRVSMQHSGFNRVVFQSLQTSEGYDQALIKMVNDLEDELAIRASFGYKGGKDPMTGKTRQVVMPAAKPDVTSARMRAAARVKGAPSAAAPAQVVDPVRLTAIIFDDDARQFTAIVMDGERSLSVQVGDRVGTRVVSKITAEELQMETNTAIYKYDIYGNSGSQPK
jgi:hypothetical protein